MADKTHDQLAYEEKVRAMDAVTAAKSIFPNTKGVYTEDRLGTIYKDVTTRVGLRMTELYTRYIDTPDTDDTYQKQWDAVQAFRLKVAADYGNIQGLKALYGTATAGEAITQIRAAKTNP